MIRYAVVGAGWISQEAFMPAVSQTGNSRMTALVSGNAEGARKLAAFHGIDHVVGYDDYDRLLAGDLVDAVYIAVPNSLHADYAIRAAKAGKHVLVEKPIATSVADAEAMIAAARNAGVHLMTSYRLHHEPGTVAALEAVHDGRIGEPLLFSSVFGFQSALGNHRLNARHWGGPLQDIGIYCINMARHVFGAEPVEAFAVAARPAGDARFAEVDASIGVTLRFPGDRLAQFHCSFGAAEVDTYRVVGSKGDLSMEPAYRFENPPRMRLNAGGARDVVTFDQIDQFASLIAYFSDCIARGIRPEADGEEGLADLRVLLAIETSAQTGQPQAMSCDHRPRRPTSDMVRLFAPATRKLLLES